jgi:hypothetical protein
VTDTVLTALAAVLPTLPPHTRVALLAFNDAVHFFTPPLPPNHGKDTTGGPAAGGNTGGGTALRMLSVPDLDEMCLPLPPDKLLLPLDIARNGLLELFDAVRRQHKNGRPGVGTWLYLGARC